MQGHAIAANEDVTLLPVGDTPLSNSVQTRPSLLPAIVPGVLSLSLTNPPSTPHCQASQEASNVPTVRSRVSMERNFAVELIKLNVMLLQVIGETLVSYVATIYIPSNLSNHCHTQASQTRIAFATQGAIFARWERVQTQDVDSPGPFSLASRLPDDPMPINVPQRIYLWWIGAPTRVYDHWVRWSATHRRFEIWVPCEQSSCPSYERRTHFCHGDWYRITFDHLG